MTGLYPEAHGVQQWRPGPNLRLAEGVPTLARVLSEHGWRTEAYTGGGNVRAELGFDAGFDVYESHGHEVDGIVDRADAALRRLAEGAEPFLLFVHTFGVHDPYLPPEAYAAQFVDPRYDGAIVHAPRALQVESAATGQTRAEVFWSKVDPGSAADRQHLLNLYDACIAHVDAQLGRLVETLDELGLSEDTVLVFTADHGEEFGEHGGFKHNTAYEELLRVPLLVVSPTDLGARPGTRVDDPVRLIDVTPTVLDLLGLPPLSPSHGRSLGASLRGGSLRPAPLASQWLRGWLHTLQVGDHKLIFRQGDPPSFELYDLAADPGEQHDIARARPELVIQLMDRLQQLRQGSREVYERYGMGGVVELDAGARSDLEALGYLGGR